MKKSITLLSFLLCFLVSKANNVNLSNIQIVNNGPDSIYIQFDLSWDNSWRVLNGPGNYDGVWVFFKFYFESDIWAGGNQWNVMRISSETGRDQLPAGLDYWRDGLGAMFYRSGNNIGTGNVTFTGIRLGLPPYVPNNIIVKGFAIEMVYIPGLTPIVDGNTSYNPVMLLGDGNGTSESTNAFHHYLVDNFGTDATNFLLATDLNDFDDSAIETPNSFSVATEGIDSLGLTETDNNPAFPTGSAFWCMKYEISQGAYRDFLNTLLLQQQTTRTGNSPTSSLGTGALTTSGLNRNFLEIKTPSVGGQPAAYGCDANGNNIFDEADDGEFVACNFLSWPDVAAWLSWAGLTPMTEIQFERTCRGMAYNLPSLMFGEFAWGDTTLFSNTLSIANPFGANELISNASISLGNANYDLGLTDGPLRNGIFATGSSNRTTSGASFYGVMELSGNLAEPCVTVGNVAGRSFNTGQVIEGYSSSRSLGLLTQDGNSYVSFWPGCTTDAETPTNADCQVTNGFGTILRGGSFLSDKEELRTSDRSLGMAPSTREMYMGGRGVIVPTMYEHTPQY